MSLSLIEIDTSGQYSELRRGVRGLCARFGGEYWRRLDGERGYPVEFVEAMTAAGFLAALIPEEYGGGGASIAEASVSFGGGEPQRGERGGVPRADVYYGGAGKARLGGAAGTVAAAAGGRAIAAAGIWCNGADGRARIRRASRRGRNGTATSM